MTRYKMTVAYDGTNYSGFQVQNNAKTIQGEIEKELKKIAKGEMIRVHAAGRTDAGVHAKAQIFHFDFPLHIPAKGMLKGLNAGLPGAIRITHAEIVDKEFHSRYLAKGKTYEYRVINTQIEDPFKRMYALHHRHKMNLELVREALVYFEGTHDFTSFTSAKTDKENKIRTIYEANVEVDERTNEWIFTFKGNGFLYNMIRIIMGTVLQVADGRRPISDIPKIIEAKDREAAGPTVDARGLCMVEVHYV